jgi:peroxygenase
MSSHQSNEALAKGGTAPSLVTGIPQVPITLERKPFINPETSPLKSAGTARANIAATVAAPHGTLTNDYAAKHGHRTVLQQHCDFFDTDHDGILWPRDTYVGFRALGFGILLSLLAVVVIHGNFSWPTVPYWPLMDPWGRIWLERIHHDKHGSDSGTFDHEGRFVPQGFEDFWSKFGTPEGTMDKWQLWSAVSAQRVLWDPVGWGGAVFEWLATWLLFWPQDGVLKKEEVRGVFDGSVFYEIARRNTGRKWPEVEKKP